MFWLGSLITVFGIMMVSLCNNFWQLILAQGITMGLGETLLLCPAIALVSQHFKKRLSIALGITIASSSLGGVVWPVIMHSLLDSSLGFGWSMRIAGFIMLPILAVSCMIARPPVQAESSTKAPKPKPAWDWSLVTKPEMLLTASAFFLVYFGMFIPFFYTTDYALSKGFSSNLSFYTISLVNGASLFGRVLPGFVADKWGRFNLCIVMTALSGIISLCMTTVSSVAGLVFFSLAYGFTSGVSSI
jgi:MFS family permease